MEDKQGSGVLTPQFVETILRTIVDHHLKLSPEEYRRIFREYEDGYGNLYYKLIFDIRGYMNSLGKHWFCKHSVRLLKTTGEEWS